MPVRRFLGYFVALAACATVAFASFGGDDPAAPDSFAAASPYSALPISSLHVHSHKAAPKHVQIAQAE